jgi:AcrR family transcriptional regulator
MARPREQSDGQLLAAIAAGLSTAQGSWSLADAAEAAGVHPATLIKRFGSRHGVLVALSQRWIDSIPSRPVTEDAVCELTVWIDSHTASPTKRPEAVAKITMLIEDLKDDELAELLRQGWDRQRRYVAALIIACRAQGDLTRAPEPRDAAALIVDALMGSALRAAAGPTAGSSHTRAPVRALLKGWT